MSEDLVKTVRGRTQAFYQRHDDLSVGQIAPVGTCAQWRSATKVRTLPYKAYFDLTEELLHKGATGPWGTVQHFLRNAFGHAVALMAPIIRRVTNDEYFYTFLKDQQTTQGWSAAKQGYPPRHLVSGKVMPAFGWKYFCDHRWTSGCLETAIIRREYKFAPNRAVYSLELSTGRHRMACNHAIAKNTSRSGPHEEVASLHPSTGLCLNLAGYPCP